MAFSDARFDVAFTFACRMLPPRFRTAVHVYHILVTVMGAHSRAIRYRAIYILPGNWVFLISQISKFRSNKARKFFRGKGQKHAALSGVDGYGVKKLGCFVNECGILLFHAYG